MSPTLTLSFVAAWFCFGMARIVFTSTLVEHRIDQPDPVKAIAFTWQAAAERIDTANYDSQGRRLLPWYRVVTTTYWMLVGSACWWAVRFG